MPRTCAASIGVALIAVVGMLGAADAWEAPDVGEVLPNPCLTPSCFGITLTPGLSNVYALTAGAGGVADIAACNATDQRLKLKLINSATGATAILIWTANGTVDVCDCSGFDQSHPELIRLKLPGADQAIVKAISAPVPFAGAFLYLKGTWAQTIGTTPCGP